jgi:hypothetical protein
LSTTKFHPVGFDLIIVIVYLSFVPLSDPIRQPKIIAPSIRLGQIPDWYRSTTDNLTEIGLFTERFLTELIEILCSYQGVKRLVAIFFVKGCLNQPAP